MRTDSAAQGFNFKGNSLETDYTYTGQKVDGTGLMYYNARYYDPQLGLFVSPDSIVPDATNVFDYNRYMYVRGNPLIMNDPTGHIGNCTYDAATAQYVGACSDNNGIGGQTASIDNVTGIDYSSMPLSDSSPQYDNGLPEGWNLSYGAYVQAEYAFLYYQLNMDSYFVDQELAIDGDEAAQGRLANAQRYAEYGLNKLLYAALQGDEYVWRMAWVGLTDPGEFAGVMSGAVGFSLSTRFISNQKIFYESGTFHGKGTIDLQPTIDRINGKKQLFPEDGLTFRNSQNRLPTQDFGYYREYRVPTIGMSQKKPGPQRIVTGEAGDIWYTPDHYNTFIRVD